MSLLKHVEAILHITYAHKHTAVVCTHARQSKMPTSSQVTLERIGIEEGSGANVVKC